MATGLLLRPRCEGRWRRGVRKLTGRIRRLRQLVPVRRQERVVAHLPKSLRCWAPCKHRGLHARCVWGRHGHLSNIALSRQAAQQRATDVIANNIANANTPGFKAERRTVQRLADAAEHESGTARSAATSPTPRIGRHGASSRPERSRVPATPSTLRFPAKVTSRLTRRVVQRLTRDGRFGLMPNGTISDGQATGAGQQRQADRRIAERQPDLHCGDGTVSSENGQLGKVGVVKPADPMQLTAEGDTLFRSCITEAGAVASPGIMSRRSRDHRISNVRPIRGDSTRMLEGLLTGRHNLAAAASRPAKS